MGYSWSSAVAQDVTLGLLRDAGFNEAQVLCVEEELFLLMRYGTDVYLEKMSVKDRQEETASAAPYAMLLDRRVDTTTDTPASVRMSKGVYDKQTNKTTFTLPFTATAKTQIWTAWDIANPSSTAPVLLGETSSGTSVHTHHHAHTHPLSPSVSLTHTYRHTQTHAPRHTHTHTP